MGDFSKWPTGAWSHTRWSELRRCPRAYQLKYVQKLYRIGATPLALEIGACFHRALEYLGEMAKWSKETTVADWETAIKVARVKIKDPEAVIQATRLLGAYRLRYGATNAGYGRHEVESVEEVLLAGDLHKDIGGMAAIADGVTTLDGVRYVWEHKTAGRKQPGEREEVIQGLKTGSQACVLAYAGRARWGTIPTVIRNVTYKTKVVDFDRFELSFTDDELDRWAEEQHELEQMVALSCANRDACAPTIGYKCQYFDYCYGTDAEREQLYRKKGERT